MVQANIYILNEDGSKDYFDTVRKNDWHVTSIYVLNIISRWIKSKGYEYWEVERSSWAWTPNGYSGVLASGVKKRTSNKWKYHKFLIQQVE
jgi:hypothetical protein